MKSFINFRIRVHAIEITSRILVLFFFNLWVTQIWCSNLIDPVHNLTQLTDHPTIMAAIAAANPGDVIECDPGTYPEKVIIDKSLTLQGTNEASCILDGTGLGTGSGIVINNGVTNVTIKKLTIQDYAGTAPNSYAGIYATGGNNNLTVMNCTIKDNIGGCGFYANGPVNTVNLQYLTVSGHSNAFGAARGIVIWNGLKENITIQNCTVFNNNCCGIELQDGTCSAVNMSNNNVYDNGDSGMSAVGLTGITGANTISNNTLNNNGRFGIEIKNPDGNGSNTTVSGNTVSITGSFAVLRPLEKRDLAGIAAFRRGVLAGNVDVPTGVSITGNTVSGYIQDNATSNSEGFGIVVEGTNHTVTGNTVNNNDVGIQQQAGHTPYPGDGDQSDLADMYFGRGNSPATCGNTISGNTFSGNGTNTRNNGSVGGAGFVKNTNSGETFCSIQAAINDAQTLNGHELIVYGGVYTENVNVSKSLTLKGANNGTNGCSGSRVTESRIDGLAGTAVTISANGVTLDGFELNGLIGISSTGFNDIEIINNKIYVQAAGVQLTNLTTSAGNTCKIEKNCIDLVSQVFGGTNTSAGIYVSGANGTEKVTINDNTVTDGFYGYVMHSITTNPKSIISNGTVTGCMQGIALVNTVGGPLAMVDIEIVSMNLMGFSGNYPTLPAQNFHAGIYTFTTATTVPANGIQALIQNCTISGTGSLSPSGAGIYLGDFSTGGVAVQNLTIDENTISNNLNRGIDARGYVLATITQNTMTGNGSAPWGTGGNDGFTILAQKGAVVSANNNFITHPAASTHPVTAFFTGNAPLNTITANDNSVLMNGNPNALGANSIAGTGSISAECNWWGVTGSSVPPLMSGTVDYELFLTSGVDDAPGTPGFQPEPNSCNGCVNGNSVHNMNSGEFFCSIQEAIDDAQTLNGHTLNVASGTYIENVIVNKEVSIIGPNNAIDPCSGMRVPEAIVVPATAAISSGEIFHIAASNVTISGITIDGDNTALTSGFSSTNGADIDAAEGITVYETGVNNLTVSHNIFKNLSYFGVTLYDYPAAVPSSGHTISNNKFQDFGTYDATSGIDYWGGGVLIYNNQYAWVKNNCMTNLRIGVQTGNFHLANPGSNSYQRIENNTMVVRRRGIFHNLHYNTASPLTLSNNNISGIEHASESFWDGILLSSLSVNSTSSSNTINGTGITKPSEGYEVWNVKSLTPALIDGGSVTGVDRGVFINNYDGYNSDAGDGAHASLSNISISPKASGIGIRLFDNPLATSNSNVHATLGANISISGGTDGLVIENETAMVASPLGNLSFTGQTGQYIKLISNSNNLDATSASFDGVTGVSGTHAQLFTIEDKITHGIDEKPLGFVTIKSNHAFVTDVAPSTGTNNDYTRIRNAVELAGNNWTINLKGTFDWTETNAATSWSLGNDGIVSPADDYSILIPANRNGVTFTAPEGLGTASITGPGDLASVNLEGVLVFDGGDNQSWTISNIEFKEFDLSIGMFFGAGGSDAFNNTTITNNRFDIATDLNAVDAPADVNQNIGIHYAFGTNQTISNNIFNVPGDGVSNGANYSSTVCMQSNTSGGNVYDGLLISGNTINILNAQSANPQVVLGIWENGHAHTSNITVSNNQFLNLAGGNNPALNLQRGFRVTSHSDAGTNVVYSGNTVKGANIGFQWISGSNFSAQQAVQLTGNILNGNDLGVLLQSNGKALFTNNDFDDATDNTKDIQIQAGSMMTTGGSNQYAGETYYIENLSSSGVNISGETFDQANLFRQTDRIYGALDDAASGLIRFDGNNLYVSTPGTGSSDESISRAMSAASMSGDNIHIESGSYSEPIDASSKDVTVTPGSSPGCVTVTGLTLGGGDELEMEINGTTVCTDYDQIVVNGTVALGGANLDLSLGYTPLPGDQFVVISNDGADPVSGTFAQGNMVSTGGFDFKINYSGGDGNDVVLSVCLPVQNVNTGEYFCTIQAAIDDPQTLDGHVIIVAAGNYTEAININKALTINGPNVGVAGTGMRVAESVLLNCSIDINNGGTTVLDGLHILRTDAVSGDQIILDGNGVNTVQNCLIERNGSAAGTFIRAITTSAGGGTKNILNNKITGDPSGGLFGSHKSWNNALYINAGSALVNITGNTIMNCRTSLNVDDYNSNLSISGNTFNNNGTHISLGGVVPTSGSHTLGANDFINNAASTMVNLSNVAESFRFNITSSSLNGTAFSALTDAQLFEMEARMAHKEVTASKKGKVIYKASQQYVNNFTVPVVKIDKIQNSIKYADASDVINLEDGTYTEKLVIDKSNITLKGVTNSKAIYILDGTGLGIASGILLNSNVTNVSIKDLTVQNFSGAGGNSHAGIYATANNNNLTIDNVFIKDNTNASGIYANGPIDNVSITNSMVSNHVTGARGIVIWNGLKTNITITNNMVTNNSCCGIELQDGDASAVNISDNTIDIGVGDNAIGVVGLTNTTGANTINDNTITGGGRFGIEIKNPAAGVTVNNNSVTLLSQNTDQRDRAGIAILRRGVLGSNVDIPNGVTITNNTVDGYQQSSASEGFGIVVEGINHVVTGNTVQNCEVGILQQQNPSNYPGDADQSNLPDQYFGRGNSPHTCGNTISSNTFSGNGTNERNIGVGFAVVTNVNNGKKFCSIQSAIDDSQTMAGHVLSASDGLYKENVVVNKAITINGSGNGNDPMLNTVLKPMTSCSGTGITVSTSNVTLNNMHLTDYQDAVALGGVTDPTLTNMALVDYCRYGIRLDGSNTSVDVTGSDILRTSNLAGTVGIRAGTANAVNGMVIDDCTINGNVMGMAIFQSSTPVAFDNINIKNSTISNNSQKGMYFEKLSNATLENLTMDNNGNDPLNNVNNGIDINLKYGSYSNITIKDCDITNSGATGIATDPQNPCALAIKARDDAPFYNTIPASLNNVIIKNNKITGPQNGIRIGEFGKINTTPTNVTIEGNDLSFSFAHKTLISRIDNDVTVKCNWHGTTDLATVLSTFSKSGTGNILLSTVLNSGVDASMNVGFQPAGSCVCPNGNLVTNNNTSQTYCTIQAAIDDALTLDGHTLIVGAGLYIENIIVDKQLNILGPNSAINPCTSLRVSEAVVVPSIAAISSGEIFHVAKSNVTISGFTIDGDNTAITSGFTSTNGADIDAAEGITVYETGVNNLTATHNIIKNLSYFGITLYDYPAGVPSTGHTIAYNQIKDLGTYDATSGIDFWGGGVLLYNNQYANVKENCMTNVRLGVQTGNFYSANPGSSTFQVIENNTISARRRGIFHNLFYTNGSAYTLSGNTITGVANVNETGAWDGILLSSLSGATHLASSNIINGSAITGIPKTGIGVWNDQNAPTISGGTISSVGLGINVNNFEGYPTSGSNANNTLATIDGVTITGASIAGIKIQDHPSNSNNATVFAEVKGNTEINGSPTGILVSGSDATATIQNNLMSIHDNAIGIDVDAATATIHHNAIYDNGTGIRFTNGGTGTVHTNKFENANTNSTDLQLTATAGNVLASPDNWFAGSLWGVENLGGTTVDATLNYWNAANGPSGAGSGSGAAISTNVEYCQFLNGVPSPFGGMGVATSPTVTIGETDISGVAPNDDIICNGASATLDATTTGATSYSWSTGANTASIVVSPGTTTTYTVTVSFPDCDVTATKTITVNPLPVCNISGTNGPVCPSSSNDFTGPAGMSYSWSVTGNASIPGSLTSQTVTVIAGSTNNASFTLNLEITDVNGCSSSCSKTVSVQDNVAPTPTCEMAQTIALNSSCQLAVPDLTDGATATDNCSMAFTWSQNPTSGTLLASGEGTTHTVTVTANDGNGNSATCTVVLTGNDNTNPVPTCEMAQTIALNSSCQLAVPDLTDGATATDNCSMTFTWSQNPTSGTLLASGEGTTHTVTVTANDGNGNSATCTVVLTGNDNTNPVPTCEMAQTIALNSSCQLAVPDLTDGATATDNCSMAFTWSQNPTSGTLLASGEGTTHTVTVTANDGNGNSATCTVVLTGNDNTNPVPTCEMAQTIALNSSCQLAVPDLTDGATATDNCSMAFTWSQNPTSGTLLASGEGTTHTVTVTANDGNGNSATCTVVLTGDDITPPVPDCENNQTLSLDANCEIMVPDKTNAASATDNCSSTFTWTQNPLQGAKLPSGEGMMHIVTVTVSDGNGNSATCTVVLTGNDNTNPVPTCEMAQTIALNSSCQLAVPDLTDGATATDNCSMSFTWSQNPTSGTLLASGEGTTHTVTVTANDGNGNSATCTVVLTGNDNTNPVPTCEMAQTISLNSSCQLAVPDLTDGATATDNCSMSFTWSQNPTSGTLLASGEGTTHTVTVTANDGNGNSATCTVVLTGNDNTNPVPTCEMAQTIALNSSCQLAVPDLTDGATATDNCSMSFTWSQNPTSGTLLASGEGTTHTVTVTANDGNGNSATCTVVLTGNDNTNPVPTCEMAQTIALNSSCQLAVPDLTDGATATDNCSMSFTWSQNPTSGTLLASGEGTTHTVTVTANDGNGNSATCTVVLTGNDNTNPVPTCEMAQTIALNSSCQLAVPDLTDGATATDNCSMSFTWSQNPTSGTLLASGEGTTHTVTVTANDGNGNSATCTVVLTGNDNTNPVPTCEMAQTIALNSSCQLAVPDLTDGATATDNCSMSFTWSQNPTSGTLLASGEGTTHTVTVTANDGNGNSATCTVVLTGNDNTNPVPTCEMAQTIALNSSCQLAVPDLTDGATATDNCSMSFTWSQNPTSGTLLASGEGTTHTVTVTANDGNGNSATCTVVLTGNDNTNPVPTCEMAQTIALNSSCQLAVPDLTDGATATDNCSMSFTWSQNPTSGTLLASGEGTTHTVTVTANDGNGNSATCTVVLTGNDNTNPVPTCEMAQTIALNSSCQLAVPDLTDGATATDNCSMAFTWSQNPTSGTLLASGEGTTHTVTVTANDGNGNSATCTVVLTGNDNTNPVPTCEMAQTIALNSSCQLAVPDLTDGATATDNCSMSFTWSQNPTSGTLLASGEGTTHTVTVTANDGNGNSATCTVVLTGNDATPPTPVCEDPQNINLNSNCQLTVPNLTDGAIATDNCSMAFTWSQNPTAGSNLSSGHNMTHTVTVTVDDGNGNSATCTVVLTGKDVTPPVMTCPANQIRGMDEGLCRYTVVGSEFDGTASDNCGVVTKTYMLSGIESGSGSGSLAGQLWKKGITTVKWTITDAAGLSSMCSFTVNVKDLEPPQITCPPNITVITAPGQCSVPASSVSLGTPTVSDNCGIKYPLTNNSPSSYSVGVTNVKWIVKDSSNNSANCIQKVTVVAYTCGAPVQVYHTDTTHESAKIVWNPGTCATGYQLRIRKELSPGVWGPWSSWSNASGPGNTHLFMGLDESSFYHYQIRSKCGTTFSININGWFHTIEAFGGVVNRARDNENSNQLENSITEPQVELVPNPASDVVRVQITGFDRETKEVTLANLFGKLIFGVKLKSDQNAIEIDLKVLSLRSGMYFIQVKDSKERKTQQLMIER
ncbi:MAG: HYR domain-containing protein [Saprospiraceae bacterium]|nr:HYR domain-containing protein [Saprospiraceae bacterium]